MIKSSYNVIGVMSGTSLDGIDLAYMTLTYKSKWTFNILRTETMPYTSFWKQKLSRLVDCQLEDIKLIDRDYTLYLSEVINDFIRKNQLTHIDAVCSHGHTALHQPEQQLTYQIGNLPKLSSLTKQLVVCDFRTQDVCLNGQGAPLVPIGDRLLFSEYDYCINLGGFANVSSEVNNKRLAYDICPVNIVLNRYANLLGYDYDDNGAFAKAGELNESLLKRLNQLHYYKQSAPKSLGLEWVDRHVFPLLENSQLSEKDILRTVVEHVAIQISNVLNKHSKVLFTGGGVYNRFLLDRIKDLKECNLIIPSNAIVEYKEAMIFGLLGVLKLRGEINCLSSVTGADYDHSSGEIYYP